MATKKPAAPKATTPNPFVFAGGVPAWPCGVCHEVAWVEVDEVMVCGECERRGLRAKRAQKTWTAADRDRARDSYLAKYVTEVTHD